MCGIVAYTGQREAAPIILQALYDLEYRGYDSAGIALVAAAGSAEPFTVIKREGKIANLEIALNADPLWPSTTGIGHTRWATHGRPNDRNAHPHSSCGGDIVVVHNGIVENYAALRDELTAAGHIFLSETDTETVAHLVEDLVGKGSSLLEAVQQASARLEGSQAIVAMSATEPGTLVAARIGNAGGVVVGYGDGEMIIASDLAAVLPHTQRVAFLSDGQVAHVQAGGVSYFTVAGAPVAVEERVLPVDPVSALKGAYSSYMLKEMMEQPDALTDTIRSLVSLEPPEVHLRDLGAADARLKDIRRVVLLGMGTSLHAAMLGRAYIEGIARIPAEVDNASEFRYRRPVLDSDTLVVSVSQSGETVDVLEAMAVAREAGALLVTICNTEGSQTTRVSDGTVYTRAGLERGVASTKCYTAAVVALYALALRLGEANGVLSAKGCAKRIGELSHLPSAVAQMLTRLDQIETVARTLRDSEHLLFLGRGLAFPTAMEGALKMKEISYNHAEGYAGGEMKHGPIALIDTKFPTVAIATEHALRSKLVSNIQQIQARGGPVIAICSDGDDEMAALVGDVIFVPVAAEQLEPIVSTIALQFLAYYVAIERGCDVDQPRNLAKTVTVE